MTVERLQRLERDRIELVEAARKRQPDLVRRIPDSFKLDFALDIPALVKEIDDISVDRWYGQKTFSGGAVVGRPNEEWRVLSLRSIAGDAERTDPGGAEPGLFEWTQHAHKFSRICAFLEAMPLELQAVRFMALVPGGRSPEHIDSCVGLSWGRVRLHVPLHTTPGAVVVFDGREVHWDEGLWLGSFSLPHYVQNLGDRTRIHLVIDGIIRPEFLDLLPGPVRSLVQPGDVLVPDRFAPDPGMPRCRYDLEIPQSFLNLAASAEEIVRTTRMTPVRLDPVSGSVLALHVNGRPRHLLMRTGPHSFQVHGWPHKSLAVLPSPFGTGVELRERVGPLSCSRMVRAVKTLV